MAQNGARQVALRVLRRVEEGAYVPLALDGECQRAKLTAQDRRLCTALVYGVLKGRARLDFALAAYAPRGLGGLDATTLDILRLGAVQILDLRVPAHAAVDEMVGILRNRRSEKLGGFANALLRKLAQKGAPPVPDGPLAKRLSVVTGAPEAVVQIAIDRLGAVEAEALLLAEAKPAPLWLRCNPRRTNVDAALAELGRAREDGEAALERSSLMPGAIALRGAEGIFDLPAYVEGRVTLQDLGAQLVGALVDAQPGEQILDACAGVGGKSTQLAERMDDRGRVDAVDQSERKLELGQDHARRLGLTIVRSLKADLTVAGGKVGTAYDRALIDAPCSGLGVARRHPEVRLRRANAELPDLIQLQARLLSSIADRVRPGGVLVYAVCTYTNEEGPAQIERFLKDRADYARDEAGPIPEPLRARGAAGELRTWPHHDDADAFFAARLKRLK